MWHNRRYLDMTCDVCKAQPREKCRGVSKNFTVEVTSPCGRANYDGGETVLHSGKKRFFGTGEFFTSQFPGLEDGDEVEVTVTVVKRASA